MCVPKTFRAVGIIFEAAKERAASGLTKFGLLQVIGDVEGGGGGVGTVRVVGDAFLTEVSDWRFWRVSTVSTVSVHRYYGPRVRRVRGDGNNQGWAVVPVESTVGQIE